MKRNCEICGVEFDPNDYATFHFMRFCSEKCEGQAEAEGRALKTGVHMFMCVLPLEITLVDAQNKQYVEIVKEGSKWQRDESQSRGLNAYHLINLSGLKDEPIGWLEITEEALKKHFERF